jgi:hypothetical protein
MSNGEYMDKSTFTFTFIESSCANMCLWHMCFWLETVMKHCKHRNVYQVVATSGKDIFILIRTSRPALWPTKPPI